MSHERLLIFDADRIQLSFPRYGRICFFSCDLSAPLTGLFPFRQDLYFPAFRKLGQRCHPPRTIFHSIDSAEYLLEFSLGQTLCGIFLLRSQRRPAFSQCYYLLVLSRS
jgi:hypothetical protein